MNIDAIKDGEGNIIISEESFREVADTLGLISSVLESTIKSSRLMIDSADINDGYIHMNSILNQKYEFELLEDGYFLAKKFPLQSGYIPWNGIDAHKVRELFKDTKLVRDSEPEIPLSSESSDEAPFAGDNPEPTIGPWLIERSSRTDYIYLTISENGRTNRPWTLDELEQVKNQFNP